MERKGAGLFFEQEAAAHLGYGVTGPPPSHTHKLRRSQLFSFLHSVGGQASVCGGLLPVGVKQG